MSTKEYKTLQLADVKVSDAGPGEFTGRASTFGSVDSYGDVVDPGAYAETLPNFLKRGFISWGHDWASPVAMVLEAEERKDGLWIKGRFHSTPTAQEARTIVKERLDADQFMGLSIGYQVDAYEVRETDPPIHNRWGELTDKVRALTKITLFEVALVTVPAEPLASVAAAKDAGNEPVLIHANALLEELKRDVKAGRAISEARRVRIAAVSGGLRTAAEELDDVISEAPEEDEEEEPKGTPGPAETEVRNLYERFVSQTAFYARKGA